MKNNIGIYRKILIIPLLLSVVLCVSSCKKYEVEYSPLKRTMVEENEIKYYFREGVGEYHFSEAKWVLTVVPKEDAIKEILNNEVKLSLWSEGEDLWHVTLEKTIIGQDFQGKEYTWDETYWFRSESDFSEETLVEEPHFHSNYKRSFYTITEHYATPDDLKQIIENGEIICAGLNSGNVAYLDKAYIVYE